MQDLSDFTSEIQSTWCRLDDTEGNELYDCLSLAALAERLSKHVCVLFSCWLLRLVIPCAGYLILDEGQEGADNQSDTSTSQGW